MKRKWYNSDSFLLILLGALGAALTAAVENVVQRLVRGKGGAPK